MTESNKTPTALGVEDSICLRCDVCGLEYYVDYSCPDFECSDLDCCGTVFNTLTNEVI